MSPKKKILPIVLRAVIGLFFIYGLAIVVGAGVGYFVGKDAKPNLPIPNLPIIDQYIAQPAPEHPPSQEHAPTPPQVSNPHSGLADPVQPQSAAQPVADVKKSWRDNAIILPPYAYRDKKLIAIIIDDAGMNVKRTKEIIDIKSPLVLSFLPYAPNLQRQANAARAGGHEVMGHIPMEAESADAHPGPHALMTDMTDEEILHELRQNLDFWNSYIGINNHMGSLFTSDPHRMDVVLQEIKRRDLIFIDSMTSAKSVAGKKAEAMGIVSASRDVFLDDVDDAAKIKEQFRILEKISRKQGSAIAIGHPRANTIAALKEWLISTENSDYMVVPLSVILLERQKMPDKKHHQSSE